jgi:hypothetical protein
MPVRHAITGNALVSIWGRFTPGMVEAHTRKEERHKEEGNITQEATAGFEGAPRLTIFSKSNALKLGIVVSCQSTF